MVLIALPIRWSDDQLWLSIIDVLCLYHQYKRLDGNRLLCILSVFIVPFVPNGLSLQIHSIGINSWYMASYQIRKIAGWLERFPYHPLQKKPLASDPSMHNGTCVTHVPWCMLNTLILGVWCSTIRHLPGCFCLWTFFKNIGFNMVPSGPFMSHLATQLAYSAGEFEALQLIVLAMFGVVD